jgi:hypothetical protein
MSPCAFVWFAPSSFHALCIYKRKPHCRCCCCYDNKFLWLSHSRRLGWNKHGFCMSDTSSSTSIAPSWAKLTIALGSGITFYSFYEYFSSGGAVSGSALGFVYGLPILLLGLALQYAELPPAPLETNNEMKEKREYLATDVQKKMIKDVTRYRYGSQAHLEQVWKALGLISRGQPSRPVLKQVVERIEKNSGRYELCLLLSAVNSQVSIWEQKLEKMNRFFGPNIVCSIQPAQDDQFWLVLTSLKDASSMSSRGK